MDNCELNSSGLAPAAKELSGGTPFQQKDAYSLNSPLGSLSGIGSSCVGNRMEFAPETPDHGKQLLHDINKDKELQSRGKLTVRVDRLPEEFVGKEKEQERDRDEKIVHLSEACAKKECRSTVLAAIEKTPPQLNSRIDNADGKVDECANIDAATKDDVSKLRGDLGLMGTNVKTVREPAVTLGAVYVVKGTEGEHVGENQFARKDLNKSLFRTQLWDKVGQLNCG